jgi:hypothetical protein
MLSEDYLGVKGVKFFKKSQKMGCARGNTSHLHTIHTSSHPSVRKGYTVSHRPKKVLPFHTRCYPISHQVLPDFTPGVTRFTLILLVIFQEHETDTNKPKQPLTEILIVSHGNKICKG